MHHIRIMMRGVSGISVFGIIVIIIVILFSSLAGFEISISQIPENYRGLANSFWIFVYTIALVFVILGAWTIYKREI